ncbi:MAG: Eco57I restriction-modification methylase domain-containing protein, partial [Promethearchaeota archaeon]
MKNRDGTSGLNIDFLKAGNFDLKHFNRELQRHQVPQGQGTEKTSPLDLDLRDLFNLGTIDLGHFMPDQLVFYLKKKQDIIKSKKSDLHKYQNFLTLKEFIKQDKVFGKIYQKFLNISKLLNYILNEDNFDRTFNDFYLKFPNYNDPNYDNEHKGISKRSINKKLSGEFFTSNREIEFMSKRSLIEVLARRLTKVPKKYYYELIFKVPFLSFNNALTFNDDSVRLSQDLVKYFDENNVWDDLKTILDTINILEPACGSGAFIIGVLNLLTKLYSIIYRHLKLDFNEFEIRKNIIQNNLFGVDINNDSIKILKFRLFISLIASILKLKEQGFYEAFNTEITVATNFNNESGVKIPYKNRSVPNWQHSDVHDFINNIIKEKIGVLIKDIEFNLYCDDFLLMRPSTIKKINRKLRIKNKFDLIIGNPPYIRQEHIQKPNSKIYGDVADNDYKSRIARAILEIYPSLNKINKKSDYYIYFYFKSLSLLNKTGILCFITSNAWLDVDYGKSLRDFLAKYVPIITVYEFPKKSFNDLGINTIISLLGAPQFSDDYFENDSQTESVPSLKISDFTAKFVSFKKGLGEFLDSINPSQNLGRNMIDIINALYEIDKIANIQITREYSMPSDLKISEQIVETDSFKVFPIFQKHLSLDHNLFNKWGGA